MNLGHVCIGFVVSAFVGFLAFFVYGFVTFDVHRVGLAANIERRACTLRAVWSGYGKSEVSVVRTTRRSAPIAIALVQRLWHRRMGIGASLTPEQALALAKWLREAAGQRG